MKKKTIRTKFTEMAQNFPKWIEITEIIQNFGRKIAATHFGSVKRPKQNFSKILSKTNRNSQLWLRRIDSFLCLDRQKWRFIVLQGYGLCKDGNKWSHFGCGCLGWRKQLRRSSKVAWTIELGLLTPQSWVRGSTSSEGGCRIRTRSEGCRTHVRLMELRGRTFELGKGRQRHADLFSRWLRNWRNSCQSGDCWDCVLCSRLTGSV